MRTAIIIVLAALLGAPVVLQASPDDPAQTITRHTAPEGARVYIISPADGATVERKFTVRFGLQGMGVAPAGVDKPNTGHHHLLIDVDTLPPGDLPIPADKQHIHFGGGQTEAEVELEPGTHTLQLDLGDANHVQFNPPLTSQVITVHVQ